MFKVGEIVWHPQYKRGEVAYATGTDVRVMFEDAQYNPIVSTEAPIYVDKEDLADVLRFELKELEVELAKEFASQELTKEQQDQVRRERQESIIHENENIKEQAQKAPLDGQVIWWDADINWEVPTQPGGQPDVRYKFPTLPGYYFVEKATQPMGMHRDPETKKLKFHPIGGETDFNLKHSTSGAKFRVRLSRDQIPALPTARKVQPESISILMEDDFGNFGS